MEWVLNRTATDLMGKLLLCWATVVLWVRAAPGVQWHIFLRTRFWCAVARVDNKKSERQSFLLYHTACSLVGRSLHVVAQA